MRYFYSKQGPAGPDNATRVLLALPSEPYNWYVDGFEDPRIKLGSIYPLTQYTGYLDIEEPEEPTPLGPEQPELPLDEEPQKM